MREIVVAVIGAVAVVLAAVLPPLLKRRTVLRRAAESPAVLSDRSLSAIVNPPVWSAWLFGVASTLLLGLSWLRALLSGTGSNRWPRNTTALPFIEMMLFGIIAAVLFAYIMQRGALVSASAASYVAAFLGSLLLVHLFLSDVQMDTNPGEPAILTASSGYTVLLFILASVQGMAFFSFFVAAVRRARFQT